MSQSEKENVNEEITSDNSEDSEEKEEYEILSSDSFKYDYNYKIIVIGNSSVGKTCLTYRASTGEFNDRMPPTLGFDYSPFFLRYKDKILKLEIWDTCGQESYRAIIKTFFTNASLAIIVYAIDDENSFLSVEEWVRQCKEKCSPTTKFFLIGNKVDLDDQRKVSYEKGKEIMKNNNIEFFIETSAKNGFNVNELFCEVGKSLYQETLKNSEIDKVSILNNYILLFMNLEY